MIREIRGQTQPPKSYPAQPILDVITFVGTVAFMLLELKLRKIGNSVGIVLPKDALAHLRASEGDTISVTEAPDGSLRLSPSNTEVNRQMEAVQDVMKRYRHTLRELAK